jgi:hypothetical protein
VQTTLTVPSRAIFLSHIQGGVATSREVTMITSSGSGCRCLGWGFSYRFQGRPIRWSSQYFPTDFQVPKKCKKRCTVHGPKNGCLRSNARCRKFPGIDARFVFATHRDCRAHYRNRPTVSDQPPTVSRRRAKKPGSLTSSATFGLIASSFGYGGFAGIGCAQLCFVLPNCEGRPLARD